MANRGRPGFTLLEATLALAMLASVMVVCLELRSQTIVARRGVTDRAQADRDVQMIVTMLTGGGLGAPEVNPETRERHWVIDLDGRTFDVKASKKKIANPIAGHGIKGVSDEIEVWEYTIDANGRVTRMLWHR